MRRRLAKWQHLLFAGSLPKGSQPKRLAAPASKSTALRLIPEVSADQMVSHSWKSCRRGNNDNNGGSVAITFKLMLGLNISKNLARVLN